MSGPSNFKIVFINNDKTQGWAMQLLNNLDDKKNLQPVIWKHTIPADKNGGQRGIEWQVQYAVTTVEQITAPDGTIYTGRTMENCNPFDPSSSHGVSKKYYSEDGNGDDFQWADSTSVTASPGQIAMTNLTADVKNGNPSGEFVGINVNGDLVATTEKPIKGDTHVLATIVPKYYVRHFFGNVMTGKIISADQMGDWLEVDFAGGDNYAEVTYDGLQLSVTKMGVIQNLKLYQPVGNTLRDPFMIAFICVVKYATKIAIAKILADAAVRARQRQQGVEYAMPDPPSSSGFAATNMSLSVTDRIGGVVQSSESIAVTIHDSANTTDKQVEQVFTDAITKQYPTATVTWKEAEAKTIPLYRRTALHSGSGNSSTLLNAAGISAKDIDELRRLLQISRAQQTYSTEEKRPW